MAFRMIGLARIAREQRRPVLVACGRGSNPSCSQHRQWHPVTIPSCHAPMTNIMTGILLSSAKSRLTPLQERRDALLVVLADAGEQELIAVHVAGEIVQRMCQAVDGELGHGDRKGRLARDL